MRRTALGPDVVIAGSARSGTSHLAARVGQHPLVDPGAVKEPEYFSRFWDRGSGWYESLYQPRRAGLLRLDSSMSYTVPRYSHALDRLADVSPDAYVVYAVRDPLRRALSHYRLLRHYFQRETAATFGDALRMNEVYLGAGDYRRWLSALYERFPRDRVLVLPFDVTTREDESTDVLFDQLGLHPHRPLPTAAEKHTNQVVEFRHGAFRRARRVLMHSGAYPMVRRRLGNERMRRLRAVVTHEAPALTLEEAVASCDPETLQGIEEVASAGIHAVDDALLDQDRRLGLAWRASWSGSAADGLALVRQARA